MKKTALKDYLPLADTENADSNSSTLSYSPSSGAELMKRNALLFQVALLALVGCTGTTTPVATPSVETEVSAVAEISADNSDIATLVSLKVPNMH